MYRFLAFLMFAIIGLCMTAYALPKRNVEIIAHRGASYYAPENTLASYKLAWQQKTDAVELDIHMSKDGRIMVIHDYSTGKVAGKNLVIKNTTSLQIRSLDAGSYKGEQFKNERIPFLDEYLIKLPHNRELFIEIKCGKEVLPVLKRLIQTSRKEHQLRIIGFNLDTISAFKQLMPNIPVYWLLSANSYDTKIIETAKSHKLDGIDLSSAGVDQKLVDAAKLAGLKVYVWTVDDPAEAKRLINLGVDGITTNRPGFLREECGI